MCILPFLSACGYKGDLYMPKENDKTRFGVIQTGLDWRKPNPKPEKADGNKPNIPNPSTLPVEQ